MIVPAQIRHLRLLKGLRVAECAKMIHRNKVSWYRFENGSVPMDRSLWELFCYKVFYPPYLISPEMRKFYEQEKQRS